MQSVKQEPIYLPEVENNPQPGHYADMIQKMQNSGGEYWQIWHLFAFRPETTMHLARFTQGIYISVIVRLAGLRVRGDQLRLFATGLAIVAFILTWTFIVIKYNIPVPSRGTLGIFVWAVNVARESGYADPG
jgi:hypothetical protein